MLLLRIRNNLALIIITATVLSNLYTTAAQEGTNASLMRISDEFHPSSPENHHPTSSPLQILSTSLAPFSHATIQTDRFPQCIYVHTKPWSVDKQDVEKSLCRIVGG